MDGLDAVFVKYIKTCPNKNNLYYSYGYDSYWLRYI